MTKGELAKKIYHEYQERLKNFIAQRVDDPLIVEEIFQETVLAALDSWPLFSGRSSLFTWLCGIAKHEIADYYRKKKLKTILFSRLPWLEDLAHQALGPEQLLLKKEFEARVKKTLKNLSEGYRQVLRLKYYQGYSVRQIAGVLGLTVKAVESRLFRARLAFQKAWQKNEKKELGLVFSSSVDGLDSS